MTTWREKKQRRAGLICSLGGAINFVGVVCLTIAFAHDGDSAPVSSAITSGAAAVVAVLSWMLFEEALSPGEILGIVVAIAGVVLMAVKESTVGGVLAPILAAVAMLFFGVAQICQKHSGDFMAGSTGSVYFFVGNGSVGAVALLIGLGVGKATLDHTSPRDAAYAFLAGLLLCVDMFCCM